MTISGVFHSGSSHPLQEVPFQKQLGMPVFTHTCVGECVGTEVGAVVGGGRRWRTVVGDRIAHNGRVNATSLLNASVVASMNGCRAAPLAAMLVASWALLS